MSKVSKIMVAVDFSKAAEKILHYATGVANQFKATMLVVNVVESLDKYSAISIPHVSFAELEKELQKSAEKEMDRFLAKHLDPQPVSHETRVAVGNIVEKINELAKSEAADLIVMGTHGYKGLEKMLFGSVAEGVIKTAPCPVLSVNPSQV